MLLTLPLEILPTTAVLAAILVFGWQAAMTRPSLPLLALESALLVESVIDLIVQSTLSDCHPLLGFLSLLWRSTQPLALASYALALGVWHVRLTRSYAGIRGTVRLLGRVSVALTLCLLLPLVFRPTLPWTLGERLLALAALATLLLYAGLFLFFLLSVFLLLYCRLAVPWAVPTSAFAFTLLAQTVLRFGELHTHSFEQLSTMSVWALAVNLVFLFSLFFARPDGSGDLDRSSRPAPDFLAQLLRCLEHLRRRLRE